MEIRGIQMMKSKGKKKKLFLVLFFSVMLLLMPVISIFAAISQKGDPNIEIASAKLVVPENIANLPGNTSISDAVYYLDVGLVATKQLTAYVNGTLRFNGNYKDCSISNGLMLNRNLSITKNLAFWASMGIFEIKKPNELFIINGLNFRPEKVDFILDIVYQNPRDEEIYSKSIEFSVTTSQTTIDITSISNPNNYYKGNKVPVNIRIDNTGNYDTTGYLTIQVEVKSIKAGTSTAAYTNENGAVILKDVKTFSTVIPAHQYRTIYFQIDYKDYNTGAMNVGQWKLIRVYVTAGNATDDVRETDPDFSQHISDPYYDVCPKTLGNQPHPIFIYYLWNSGGTGDTWGSTNPRDYFENGYGNCVAGLWRFNTLDSNIPIRFKMEICYDDSSWNLPADKFEIDPIRVHGMQWAGDRLNHFSNLPWSDLPHDDADGELMLNRGNCGFDILLLVASRNADFMGIRYDNIATVCKSGASTSPLYWKRNIDGVVQHEIAHIFRCEDWSSDGNGHPQLKCVMVYGTTWPPWYWFDYLHEVSLSPIANAQNSWCDSTDAHCCKGHFEANWYDFYDVYVP